LVDALHEQMMLEILAAVPIASSAAAAGVCKLWREFYATDESGLWQQLVASTSAGRGESALAAAAATACSPSD
jgi:hypothetical protein